MHVRHANLRWAHCQRQVAFFLNFESNDVVSKFFILHRTCFCMHVPLCHVQVIFYVIYFPVQFKSFSMRFSHRNVSNIHENWETTFMEVSTVVWRTLYQPGKGSSFFSSYQVGKLCQPPLLSCKVILWSSSLYMSEQGNKWSETANTHIHEYCLSRSVDAISLGYGFTCVWVVCHML